MDEHLYKRWLALRSSKSLICERWLNPIAFINDAKLLPNYSARCEEESFSLDSKFLGDNIYAPDTTVWSQKDDLKNYTDSTIFVEGQNVHVYHNRGQLASKLGISASTASRLIRDNGNEKMTIWKSKRWLLRWLPVDMHLFDGLDTEIVPFHTCRDIGYTQYDVESPLIFNGNFKQFKMSRI